MTPKERFQVVLRDVSFRDWTFKVGGTDEQPYLQLVWRSACARTGAAMEVTGRKWLLSQFMTRSEIVQTALSAVLAATEHEAREFFLYREQPIFGAHFHVDKLWKLCEAPAALDLRTPRETP